MTASPSDPAARQQTREQMREVSERLVAEFAAVVPADRVLSCIATAREELMRSGIRTGLAAATEASVRLRLSQTSPAHERV